MNQKHTVRCHIAKLPCVVKMFWLKELGALVTIPAVTQAEMDVKTSIASGTDAVSTAVRRERRTSQSRSAENL